MKSVKPSYLQNLSAIRASLDEHQSALPDGRERIEKTAKQKRVKILATPDAPEVAKVQLAPLQTIGNFELPPLTDAEDTAARDDARKSAKRFAAKENKKRGAK